MLFAASSSRSVVSSSRTRLRAAHSSASAPRSIGGSSSQDGIVASQPILRTKHANEFPAWLLPSQLVRRRFSTSPGRLRPRSTTSDSTSSKSSSDFTFPSHLSNPTPYDIFHFSNRSVSSADVKSRYYDLVRALHPDRFAAHSSDLKGKSRSETLFLSKSKSQAEEEFKLVVQAYNLLKDSKKKSLYDRAGFGWSGKKGDTGSEFPSGSGSDPWKNWQDMRYTRRYNPGYTGPGHDRFGWQNQGFYSNQYSASCASGSAGWSGGNGKYTSNGIFISTLFIVTWVLAGLQYSRLSLQSQKAIERADKSHLSAARSLNEAREQARSEEGRERWMAFRRRAREQKHIEETEAFNKIHNPTLSNQHVLAIEAPSPASSPENPYGIGHGGPSGKHAAQERFAKAQARTQTDRPTS